MNDHYAVTSGEPKNRKDLELTMWTANAKYDFIKFIEDGDLADKQIQAAREEAIRLEDYNRRFREGDLSHLLVQMQKQAKVLNDMSAIVEGAYNAREKLKEHNSQLDLISQEFELQEEASKLHRKELARVRGQHQQLQRYTADLQQAADGPTAQQTPLTELRQLQREAGQDGLRAKALAYDALALWVEEHGGKKGIQEKAAQAQAVATLTDNGGFEALKTKMANAEALAPLLPQCGAQGLNNKVMCAEAAAPLTHVISDPVELGALIELLKDEDAMKQLSAVNGELTDIANEVVDHIYHEDTGETAEMVCNVFRTKVPGNVLLYLKLIMSEARATGKALEKQSAALKDIRKDRDWWETSAMAILGKITTYQQTVKAQETTIWLYEEFITPMNGERNR